VDFKLKAQSAMEFLMLVGILLFIFVMFYVVVFERIQRLNDEKAILLGEDVATKVQKEILLAAQVSDGYQRTFRLPQKIEGMNYTIQVSGKEVTVKTPKTEVVKIIPEVVGNITKEINRINKTNGTIYLN